MKIDHLKKYIQLRQSLLREKTALERRLSEINKALGIDSLIPPAQSPTNPQLKPAKPFHPKTPRRKAVRNKTSLRKAILEATCAKPLAKLEILAAVRKQGYRFATDDPVNSLNAVLYRKGLFKRAGGKFSPA
ncbi:MAG: hypothetical protein AAB466_03015 [Verrucomicrobiota bacterium]